MGQGGGVSPLVPQKVTSLTTPTQLSQERSGGHNWILYCGPYCTYPMHEA